MKTFLMLTCVVSIIASLPVKAISRERSLPVKQEKAVTKEKLKPGDPSPELRAVDLNGKLVSLKSFKGKYVYIDLWATWCSPCVGEIPHLQKLEKKFHGKKIVFVSISCDDNIKEWKAYVKKRGLEGMQLNFDMDLRFRDAYGVKSIPRFILLDKKGKIINPDMTRPSNPETEKVLNALRGI